MFKKNLKILAVFGALAMSGAAYSLTQRQSSEVNSATTASTAMTETYQIELCTDGDTCRVFVLGGKKMRVRLVGIDAPEIRKNKKSEGQPFALEAKNFLNKQIQDKKVTIKEYGNDMYGRVLGEIYFENRNINLELVSRGFAEVYRGKAPAGVDTDAYRKAQAEAQASKLGIWSADTYQSPKDFRKKHKH